MVSRIGVLTGGGNRDDLARQLAQIGSLEWHELSTTLVERAEAGELAAAITGLHDETGSSIAGTLVEIAARRPALPLVVHAALNRTAIGDLCAVLAPGLRVECVVRPFGHLAPVLRWMLGAEYRPAVAPLLLQHFIPHTPISLLVFVTIAIIEARTRRSAEELATWSRCSLRTVERRLKLAGWPAAHVVSHSFAALDAIWLMTEYGWSARMVQEVRAFPHASSVTRLLKTYAGTRPSTLIEDGGFAAALDRISRMLLRHQ